MCNVAMFSIKTAKQVSFEEVQELVQARDGRAAEALLTKARFNQLKRGLCIQLPQLDGANINRMVRVWSLYARCVHRGAHNGTESPVRRFCSKRWLTSSAWRSCTCSARASCSTWTTLS